MKQSPYYFEIKDLLTQFVTAFDDIVIKRYNDNREIEDRISVRYVYSPKQRVLYDIINTAKTMTMPAVAVSIGGISRDNTRVFNKLDGFYYNGKKSSAHLKSPVPINIDIKMSIITRFQTDMDQILSNFIPYSNPYIVLSWKVPTDFGLPETQEIRSEVIWDGSMVMEYPTDLNGTDKQRITADTSFTIKGWLFKEISNPVGNIYYIDNNFHTQSILTSYNDLSSNSYTFPISSGLVNELEVVEVSGSPTVSNLFWNSVLVESNYTIARGVTGVVMLYGNRFTKLKGLLLSSNNDTIYSATGILTATSAFTRQSSIRGQIIKGYNVINDNIITFNLPRLQRNPRSPYSKIVIVPFNDAGYSTTAQTHLSSLSPVDTFLMTV